MSVSVEGAKAPPGLRVVHDLAARLDRAGIRYCHFKSNQHLEQGLKGITDLDVLVERDAGLKLIRILAEAGYKRFSAPPGGDFPAVEDYLAMDPDTGGLIHLHLHHQLTAGERHLKGYRLPWEDLILSTRCRDESLAFPVADPNVELVSLLARASLKIRLTDRIQNWLGRKYLRGEDLREFIWLKERVRMDRILEVGGSLLGESALRPLEEILAGQPSLRRLLALRRSAAPTLRRYRTYSPLGALLQRWRRELQLLYCAVGRKTLRLPGPISRTVPRGGLIVALVGPDGSGKSTLARTVAAWLCWKLDARIIYFGSGDGPSSLARLPMKAAQRILISFGFHRRRGIDASSFGPDAEGDPRRPASALERVARSVWALALTREKRRTLRRAWRSRNRGMVIVCDRYPQNQVMGFNDGPLLHRWSDHRSRLLRALARWESIPYRWAEADPPDLVIKLRVSPEVARQRKPDMHPAEIQRRIRAVASLRYPARTRVVEVDSDRTWDEVLLEAKRHVWEAL